MENKIYNDDVERIVNDPERVEAINEFHRKRHAKRQRKMLVDALVYLTFSLAFILLGVFNFLNDWVAAAVYIVCGAYSMFCFGRFFENGKCLGWH
jgi:hypothetical protein